MCAPLFEISQYIRKVSKAKSDVSRAVISYYHAAQKSQTDTADYHVRIMASAPQFNVFSSSPPLLGARDHKVTV
jgi:hypothetical protein